MSIILNSLVRKLMERLMGFVEGKAAMLLGVKGELERLLRKLGRIQKVLEEAERRRWEDSAINNWVNELKDILYEAEDIIDLCMRAQLLPDEQQPSSSSSPKSPPVSCSSSFFSCFISGPRRYEIAERIKSLEDRLEEIYQDRLHLNLDLGQPKTRFTAVNSRQTSPVLDELDVVGSEIEDATKDLIKLMTGEEVMRKKCNIFAITGMGGIGKTTLAQKIFNHQKVQTMFQILVWVCVSQTYNEIELLKQIIRDAKGNYGEANTKAELEPVLKSTIHGKSFFLVLDDVWRADVWIDLLRSPLQSAQIDASILITSRDDSVAKQIGSVHIHHVMHLPVETGWEMLVRRLVMMGGREEEINSLREVGIQIIEKCSGLPLAIKTMVGVLAKKETIAIEWKKVLNNTAWSMRNLPEELRGALYLSYDYLPYSLKQCFLYCSLFPENWIIYREKLIKLWVAEGFIEEEGDSLMEDKAEEYFQELTHRNLLQLDQPNYNGPGYRMHDLLRSLAQFISKDESFTGISAYKSTLPLTKLRRVSIIGHKNDASILDAIVELNTLRTLLVFSSSQAFNYNQFGRFLHLRVLDLSVNKIEIIPSAIEDLFHLRYLNLDETLIKQLPESIGKLLNLQFLSLKYCRNLTNLPQSITGLKNLRHLDLCWSSLGFMPKGIERLKKLNGLEGFVVSDYCSSSQVEGGEVIMHSTSEELSGLTNLRTLLIYHLERARPGSLLLKKLSKLKILWLKCTLPGSESGQEKEISPIQEVFEELTLPQSLEVLSIEYYFGCGYPKWIMSLSLGSYLPYLSVLSLLNNISCPLLPPLGQLPHLRDLRIFGANAVKRIGLEFLGNGVASSKSPARTAFPMLQRLMFNDMPNLEEWSLIEASHKLVLFPHLDDLELFDCHKLRSLPFQLIRSTVKRIKLFGNQGLEYISDLPTLKSLTVEDCYGLNSIFCSDGLELLNLTDCNMDCLPILSNWQNGGEDKKTEENCILNLRCNERVLQRCQPRGEDWPIIQQFQRVNASTKHGKYLRFVKQPFSFETNIEEEESKGEEKPEGEEESGIRQIED